MTGGPLGTAAHPVDTEHHSTPCAGGTWPCWGCTGSIFKEDALPEGFTWEPREKHQVVSGQEATPILSSRLSLRDVRLTVELGPDTGTQLSWE